MKKSTKILILGLICYVIPVLLFGNYTGYKSIIFLLSIVVIWWRFIKKDSKNKYLPDLIVISAFLGLFLGTFGLSPFKSYINESTLKISISYADIFGYWLSLISVTQLHDKFRSVRKIENLEEFNNDSLRLERDEKIRSILGRNRI